MNTELFRKLQNFRASLNTSFLERTEVVDGVLASILTKQNAFLFGAPGTGKSELVREISNGFSGSKFFGYLLSPTTDPSELFGPVAVSKLLKDEYVRDVEGYLPDSNIAFLDELFRGSSAVLNSLLTILNERTFNNGRHVITTPVQSIVAATNSFPQEESLQAFCDRFLFRPTVDCLKLPASKATLDSWAVGVQERPSIQSELTFEDLIELQQEVERVKINDQFLDSFRQTLELLEARGITVSDRRRVQILKFMRGWALVQGNDELRAEYLHGSLVHIVYRNVDDINVIKECLNQAVPTADMVLTSIKRASHGIETEFHALMSVTRERRGVVQDLQGLNETVSKLRRLHKNSQTLSKKIDGILDSDEYQMSAEERLSASKLSQAIEDRTNSIAKTINDLSA